MGYDKLLDRRPEHVAPKLGKDSKVCLLSARDIMQALADHEVIVMACNTRIKHVIPGIMRAAQELDAVVAFELAKSESDFNGGYTGMTPYQYFETVVDYAEKTGYTVPFFIHADHQTVKKNTEEEISATEKLVHAAIDAGYTSVAIDASFNELDDNIKITARLAKRVQEAALGLEVEVGEIKSAGSTGEITTVEEATTFIAGLKERGIHPNLLAINNGSKHGNYLEGEPVSIDLERTGEIYRAIKDDGVRIAQHGITGTPLHLVGKFADYGIRKGNVGTQWQNIAHKHLPEDLFREMKEWAASVGKDIKFATKQFKSEIDSIGKEYVDRIENEAYREAQTMIKAFRAEGTATAVRNSLTGSA